MCECFACLHVCTMYMSRDRGGQRRVWNALQLCLQTVVSCCMCSRAEPRSSARAVSPQPLSHLSSPSVSLVMFLNNYVFVTRTYACSPSWQSKDNFLESVFSFHSGFKGWSLDHGAFKGFSSLSPKDSLVL